MSFGEHFISALAGGADTSSNPHIEVRPADFDQFAGLLSVFIFNSGATHCCSIVETLERVRKVNSLDRYSALAIGSWFCFEMCVKRVKFRRIQAHRDIRHEWTFSNN